MAAHQDGAAPRPNSLADLFWSFTRLALQGFGGVLAILQRELVEEKRWLKPKEFMDNWAVATHLTSAPMRAIDAAHRYCDGGRGLGLAGVSALASAPKAVTDLRNGE